MLVKREYIKSIGKDAAITAWSSKETRDQMLVAAGWSADKKGFDSCWSVLKSLGWLVPNSHSRLTTASEKPRTRKTAGFLPVRIADWLEDRCYGLDVESVVLVIDEDSPGWNRAVLRLTPQELAGFEAWLGRAATEGRRSKQDRKARLDARYNALYEGVMPTLIEFYHARKGMKENGFSVFPDDFGCLQMRPNC